MPRSWTVGAVRRVARERAPAHDETATSRPVSSSSRGARSSGRRRRRRRRPAGRPVRSTRRRRSWVGRRSSTRHVARRSPPARDRDDPVGDVGLVVVVGDEQRGRPGRPQDRAELAGEAVVELAVEPGQRLVEQQARGAGASERARATRLASPPLRSVTAALEAGEPDQLEQSRRPLASGRLATPLHPQPEGDVGGDVAVREQLLVLEHHADAPRGGSARRVTSGPSSATLPDRGRRGRRSPAAACSCRCPTVRAGRRPRRRRRAARRRRARPVPSKATVTSRTSSTAVRPSAGSRGHRRRATSTSEDDRDRRRGQDRRQRVALGLEDGARCARAGRSMAIGIVSDAAAGEEAGGAELAERDGRGEPGGGDAAVGAGAAR